MPDDMPTLTGAEIANLKILLNGQASAVDFRLQQTIDEDHAADSVPTVEDLPETGNWVGRVTMVEENEMLYVHNGTGWWIYGGKLPFFFGSRATSPVGTEASGQAFITTADSSRGITFLDGTMTFETPGIYRVDEAAFWEANGSGQRNLGIEGTGITILGPGEFDVAPSAAVFTSQAFATYILAHTSGSTATPYITHNTGVALDVSGTVCVMWVSA